MTSRIARIMTVLLLAVASVIVPSASADAATPTRDCWQTLDGVTTLVTASQRTVTVVRGTGGSWARVSFWVRSGGGCTMKRLFLTTTARVGRAGIGDAATRRQGGGVTPRGTYTMTEAFGNSPPPRTAMPFRRVAAGDFWVEDNNSPFYNSYRNVAQGGFDAALPVADVNGSERLSSYPKAYALAVVINFNRAPDYQQAYRGAGIFLHVKGSGPTAGCVGITLAQMRTVLQNLRPGDRIVIQ